MKDHFIFGRWLCLALGLAMLTAIARPLFAGEADDDWEVVSPPASEQNAEPAQSQPANKPPSPVLSRERLGEGSSALGGTETIKACGEPAVPSSPKVKAIVAEINHVWNSDVRVYQSVQPVGPHARPGGCIFYNPTEMAGLLNGWMNIKEAKSIKPMIYAIFAHEVGHEVHRDFDPSRAKVAGDEKELEADRFAGYTMSYLRIQPDDITTYYRLTGDDFTGGQNSHGTSEQRAEAFEHGWGLAEAGSSEQSIVPARGLDHP